MGDLREAARALVADVRPGWREDMRQTVAQSRVDALRAALKEADAPQGGGAIEDRAVARAVREAALVNYNTPQEYDVACAQRAACEMAALASLDAAQEPPRAKPSEGGEGAR